jgi:hypothetical protein
MDNMEEKKVEMWKDMENTTFLPHFPYLFTIQLTVSFLPYFPNHFTIQVIFLLYFPNLFTIFFCIFQIFSLYGRKVGWNVKRYGKYGWKLCNDMENTEEK